MIEQINYQISYRVGDKVLYRDKAEQGQIWTIKSIDRNTRRCHIERRTPDRVFIKTAALHLLMLEVDLPRRIKIMAELPKMPAKKMKEEKDSSLMMTFERIASILNLLHAHGEVTTTLIQKILMPDLSIRSIQRHADALVCNGYIECIGRAKGCTNIFAITNQGRAIMNLPIPNMEPVAEEF